jgi:leucyl/phenylalanyl-tRNA--protein transferase
MIHWLGSDPQAFPPVRAALADPNGLLAAGGDLSSERLLAAYRRGIFPWYERGQPILWWCPDPRAVLFPADFRLSRRLARKLRRDDIRLTVDQGFEQVIRACAAPRRNGGGTWITGEMISAYLELHALGHAHSVEVWLGDALAGGIYGVNLGRVFFGESMFSTVTDASKIALGTVVAAMRQTGGSLIDCQVSSPHLMSLGCRDIPREDFLRLLERDTEAPAVASAWAELTLEPARLPCLLRSA